MPSATRFGSYEITGLLGVGGMGEVHRARDTGLGRDVAIKLLPASFIGDADRVARFTQEAKALAALNHPNIAHVYGIERSDGAPAIVMELVPGPTLADRIAQGPIPPHEALEIAMQIASALEAAHGKHIVHRDLKPANVKLTPEGVVKLLDFGVAKTSSGAADGGPARTLSTPTPTETGVLLGTAAYMSPEQARGQAIDQRADIWAFGCVLYEMLTGRPAFGAEDVTATLARVLERDASFDSLPPALSPAVRHTIGLCLQKDPRKRVADIRDVRLALQGAFAPDASTNATLAAAERRWPRYAAIAFAAGATVSAVVTHILTSPESPTPRATTFAVDLPAGEALGLDGQSASLAIARDGEAIVFATTLAPNEYRWYLRPIDSIEPRPLRGAGSAFETPFFSPDGRWLGFDSGMLWRLSVLGGAPSAVAQPRGRVRGANWGESGAILYADEGNGLWRVPAEGGEPQQLTKPEPGVAHRWPQWLPGEQAALFTVRAGGTDQIALLDLASGDTRTLLPDGTTPSYSKTGHIVYGVADGSLRGVRFDLASLAVVGEPAELVRGVAMAPATGGMHYALSAEGTLIYGDGRNRAASALAPLRAAWLADAGIFEPLGMEPCVCDEPAISPDGTRMAVTIESSADTAENDVWIWSFSQRTLTRLTFENPQEAPVWSRDSTRIAYRDAALGIVVRRADGVGGAQVIVTDKDVRPAAWTADERLIFERYRSSNSGIDIVAATPGAEPVSLLDDAADEFDVALSPDGRWLAYSSSESGRSEVYVRPFPDVDGGKWQVSRAGGRAAAWSPDASKLYFLSNEFTALMAAAVDGDTTFAAGAPSMILDVSALRQGGLNFGFDVHPITGRILLGIPEREREPAAAETPSRLLVVQNFGEVLKRQLPE